MNNNYNPLKNLFKPQPQPKPALPSSSVERFAALADELTKLYELKNKAYGNSFSTSVQSYGLIAALTRISDKFHRLENLILHPSTEVGDERLADTLRDLASYCLMTVMEVEEQK